ncbi:Hsp33 family molecular chaperone HslO [Sinanaerobacter sp. ZZT-01]|uniref:Hsp33 family molecular chaperone HslO n=1 Tax=Sinanaerobacter sp. ZZT-01 TaxID=3111540 RepID=UPI002D7A1CF8|nr:Hsp33 family molecular chaperone HslO [Sinanaerobacter sp. ZZT-01]WRR94862.1 Hsp33 family molecular chaperone HslO [Sinanaerobacter sp. ZZT-01]
MSKALIAIDKSASFRVYLAITTSMAEEARKIHQATPLAAAALGRVLTGTGMMALMMKNEKDKVTVQFKGDGPAKEILATAKGNGRVKGYISNPFLDLPLKENGKLDVGGALGIGTLTVIKDLGLKEPYVGRIDLVSGEIAEDLTAYFFVSEQQSSSVALGVKIGKDYAITAAGGLMIQMLPQGKEEAVDALETMLDKMKPISTLIEEQTAKGAGKTEEAVLQELLTTIFSELPEEFQVNPLEYRELSWECDCCEERLEQVLMSIGKKDLQTILEEDGQAELVCQFCTKKYQFDQSHLERLIAELDEK